MQVDATTATVKTGNEFWLRFKKTRNAVIGSVIIFFVLLVAVFGPFFTPYHYKKTDIMYAWEPPSVEHPAGTDGLGRDILSRVVYGSRVSLLVAFTVLIITLAVGTLLGMTSAYFGGITDMLIMRITDIIFAFPELILAILVASVLGSGVLTVIIALSLVWWPGIARLARSLVLSIRTELYIDAAIACGSSPARIFHKHLLPNIVAPLIVRASVGVGFIIMAEAALSFLGIGIQEPTPTWGGMMRDGLKVLRTDPHLALFSGLALAITIIGFNLFGDGLRDILDPKVRDK